MAGVIAALAATLALAGCTENGPGAIVGDIPEPEHSVTIQPDSLDRRFGPPRTGARHVAQVGRPVIDVVEVANDPSRDASGSGTYAAQDTYVVGDEIRIDVKFNEPVVVTGGGDVRLRLDLGPDDATPGNSRRTLTHPSALNGGRTLRFSYAVTSSDTDPDGVWVQTDASNRVIFEPHDDQRVVSAATGVDADLTKSGLPTTGNPKKKVDGSASASGPRPSSATVDGATVTVTFDAALDESVDTAALDHFFSVQDAGGVNSGNIGAHQHPLTVSVSDSTVTLTLGNGARAGETVMLHYKYQSFQRPLRDTDGNPAPEIKDLPLTNVTGGAAGPGPVRSWLDGSSLRIRFAGDLDESSQPAGSAFQVQAEDPDGNGRAITGTGTASVTGSEVAVTLTAAALRANEEVVSASYAKPSANPLRGVGGDVRSFDSLHVAPKYVAKPLTASFHGLPDAHDGAKLFGFEIVFSEEFKGLRLPAFEAGALEVTNGRLVDAKRVTRGENRRVAVRVRPSSDEEMMLTLPGTTDCAAAGAICADDGRMLSGPVSARVSAPLTAEFTGMPNAHDGAKLFGFEIVFSEEFRGLTLTGLTGGALAVTNGRIVDAKRVTRGENRRVAVRVRPSSNDDMTITLAAGSVSTASGRALANTVSATVAGPVGTSASDARVKEGAGVKAHRPGRARSTPAARTRRSATGRRRGSRSRPRTRWPRRRGSCR